MRASKENAKRALKHLSKLDSSVGVKFVVEFVQAAERKLPTEAAYEREKDRRKPAVAK